MAKNKRSDNYELPKDQAALLDIIADLCSKNGWQVGIIGDPENTDGEMQGLVIGIEEFVLSVQQYLDVSDGDITNFNVEENEEGVEGLVETSKETKMKGSKNYH